MAIEKQRVFRFPKRIGTCADKLYDIKQRRLAAQKVVQALEEEEKALKEHIIQTLPKSESSGVAGKIARVSVVNKDILQVKDWKKFYSYVKRNSAFELMQKRLNAKAVEERLDDKKRIPGVETFKATTISLNKI